MNSVKTSMKVNSPLPKDLAGECKRASKILNSFIDPIAAKGIDNIIPTNILSKAKGLAIFTVVKAGFLFSGRAGSGIVVARLEDGSWSAPSAIGTGGMGFGGQIGAEITDFVIVLNNNAAVKSFATGGNVTLGGNLSVAAGPVGRTAEAGASASAGSIAAIYSYSKTKGLFAGVSIEGSVIVERKDANETFYRQKVSASELLSGAITPPPQADILYRALNSKATQGGVYNYSRNSSSSTGYSNDSEGRSPSTLGVGRSASTLSAGRFGGQESGNNGHNAGLGRSSTNAATFNNARDHYVEEKSRASLDNDPSPRYSASTTTPSALAAAPKPLVNATGPRVPPRIGQKPDVVTALYDFVGEQATDLSFKKGDVITVIKKTESRNDWWTGKVNGREGSFPANYTQ